MTVRINKDALNLREELTKAQSVVPYVQQQFWMDGLVENGTFDNDISGWVGYNSTPTWDSGGKLRIDAATGSDGAQTLNNAITGLTVGKQYILSCDIELGTASSAKVEIYQADTSNLLASIEKSSSGSYQAVFTATALTGTIYALSGASATGTVFFDNIAVFEVDENDEVIHSLPLGWKPLHFYEDGLIQREGDVHDYTVVKTGGAYAIKPAVQPTATTETCVIAEREL